MNGFLIFYCLFSMLFCVATVDETNYPTIRDMCHAIIFHIFLGPLLMPVILGDAIMKIKRNY